ncbi:MAG: DUF2946 domain-containing protein [Rhodoferax sp.]
MLLQVLRQSTATARLVLVWFVLAMGVAVAAPALQPLALGPVCSSPAASADSDGGAAPALHGSWQCIQCMHLGAPPAVALGAAGAQALAQAPSWRPMAVVHGASLRSPLLARAPPQA